MRRSMIRAVVALSGLAVMAPAGIGAQMTPSPWEPWVGCWDRATTEIATIEATRVCILPTNSPAVVDLVSVVGENITSRQRLDATAPEHAVEQENCRGTERVNATGTRAYLRTTMTCGAQGRLINSVMAFTATGEWLDVRGVAFGSNVGVRASRYRETPATAQLPAEVVAALRGQPRGMHAARIAATGALRPSDIVEASRYLEIGVLQTWLAERGQGFGLDARQLVALQESGVAPSVIDVMVALSYPEVFALDRTRLGDAPPDTRGEVRGGEVFGGGMYDDYGYGYDPYGYGYGRGMGWYSGRQPVVVVQRPADAEAEDHGRVEKGRGYVSGRDDGSRAGTERSSGSGRAGSSGGSGGSSTDKGSSTGRKAKPKPPGA